MTKKSLHFQRQFNLKTVNCKVWVDKYIIVVPGETYQEVFTTASVTDIYIILENYFSRWTNR